MFANLITNKIEMTQKEAMAAGKLNSNEFTELKELREMYVGFEIVIVKAQRKKVDHFKGLNKDYMLKYIETHEKTIIDNNGKEVSILEAFYELCGKDKEGNKKELAAIASFPELKMWFLNQYPEIEEMSKNVNSMIENARKERAERKAKNAA